MPDDDKITKGGNFTYNAKRIIKRRMYLIPLSLAVVVGVMIGYLSMFPPVYTAEIKVLLEDNSKAEAPVGKFYSQLQIFRNSETAATEAELITTNQIADEVIKKLDLKYDEVYHSFFTNVMDIWKRSWVRKQYKKVKRLFIEEKPLPMGLTEEDVEYIQTIKGFKEGIKFEALRNSNVYKVLVKGPSPKVGIIANTLIEATLRIRLERHSETARGAHEQINLRLEQTKKKLELEEMHLKEYVKEHGVMFDFEKEKANVGALTEKEMALEEIRRNKKGVVEKLKKVEEELAKLDSRVYTADTKSKNPLVEEIKTELFSREMALLRLREKFSENSREVQEEKRAIESIKLKIKESQEDEVRSWVRGTNPIYQKLDEQRIMIKTDLVNITVQEKALEEYIDQLVADMRNLPEKQYEVNRSLREIEVLKKEYLFLAEKAQEAEISLDMESQKTASMTVVDWAHTPAKPSRPKKKLYLFIAFLGGIFLGIGNTFLFDYFDPTIRSDEDEEYIMGLPVFATIPPLRDSELFLVNGRRKLDKRLPPLLLGNSHPEFRLKSGVGKFDNGLDKES